MNIPDPAALWNTATGFVWQQGTVYLLLMVGLLAVMLYRQRPADRATLYNTLGFYAVSLVGLFLSGVAHGLGLDTTAATLREVFVIAGGVAVIRLWGLFIFRIALPLVRFSPPRILEDILVILAYAAWGMVRLRYAGMDLSGIVATSAIITAVIAFAMQDTLGNILGGLVLEMEDTVDIGDWIKVDDLVGRVVEIRWRSTSIETRNWETVVVPNGLLMKGKFTVLGKRTGEPVEWRRWIWFNVDYGWAPARVIAAVEPVIREAEIPNVAKTPAPNCLLMDFDGNGYGRYALRYWLTDLAADDPTDSAVRVHLYAALQRQGIRFAVPEKNIHMTKEGEKHDEAVKAKEMVRRLDSLRQVELFSKFSETEMRTVAECLRYSPFAKGDIITRQGAAAHWLYILISGEAEVFIETEGRDKRTLRVLSGGSFFGEMGLMTGEPRAATVVARSDVECYRLDKTAFENILLTRPSIAEEIALVLASRRTELDSALQNMDAAQREKMLSQQHTEILGRIRRFFGLKTQ